MKTKNLIRFSAAALLMAFVQTLTFAGRPANTKDNPVKVTGSAESLSGINLVPVKQTGTFELQFTQDLKEDGTLELKNAAGQTLFTQELSKDEQYAARKMDVGKLNSGIYLIEVKSGNTVFWKKVRIRR